MGEAQPLQKGRDMALVIGDAEAFLDDLLKVDAAPAHDTVDGGIGAGLDNLRQLGELLGRKLARGPLDQESRRPSGPAALKR